MVDIVSTCTRSRMMAGVRSKNSGPEILIRQQLFAAGFRFRLHRRDLPGSPDIVMPGRRIVIFVHGCFWHAHKGCKYAKIPASNHEFWAKKLLANARRDQQVLEDLGALGWRVRWVWECATRDRATKLVLPDLLVASIRDEAPFDQIAAPPVL